MKLLKAIGVGNDLVSDEDGDRSPVPVGKFEVMQKESVINRVLMNRKRDEVFYSLCQFGCGEGVKFGWVEKDAIDFGLGAKSDD